jgi:hypothetical protein
MAVRPLLLFDTNEAALRRKSEPVAEGSSEAASSSLISRIRCSSTPEGSGSPRRRSACTGADRGLLRGEQRDETRVPRRHRHPTIIEAGRECLDFDGCLSIPGLFAETVRPHALRLGGFDERGEPCEWTLEASTPSSCITKWTT